MLVHQKYALVDSSFAQNLGAVLLKPIVFVYPSILNPKWFPQQQNVTDPGFDQCAQFPGQKILRQQTSAIGFVFFCSIHGV